MKIGVTGINGRMGKTIANLILRNNIVELSCALTRNSSNLENVDLGEFLGFEKNGSKITSNIDEFLTNCDAVID